MLWFYGHLETFVLGVFAFGIVLHFVRRRGERQRYIELRAAYEDAVRETSESDGDPAAVVREAELRRTIMNSEMPGWFQGFGRCAARWLKYSAAAALLLLFLRGPILQGEARYERRQAKAPATLPLAGGQTRSR
ncbi:MAG: hypothetical protein NT090_04100 [Acidobacteria bacterium]|nr:hypothetical protein [Acidobacteriota bacterium]